MSNRYTPIHLGNPGEDISKKDLHNVIQRFKHFNQARLKQMLGFLQPRQQDFLHLLPLLFHQNHPLLPGFVSLDTPAGIPDFAPNKQALETAQQFSKGYSYKRRALRQYPIESLFLMGSVGSMAFSKDSDIDIWLCHLPGLEDDQLNELRDKIARIEQWAATLKLEVHVFLVDSRQFRQGHNLALSVESSGETQHYLLLEEFYRTSIYLAGKVPAWWLVPPQQEDNYEGYVQHLLANRFIAEADVIDFGGLQRVPVTEFVSATLWHIYKSLTSPHKSLLKLLLMESYASEYPSPQWLCHQLKQGLYQGDFSVELLDPYRLIYGKVDDFLQRQGSVQRLAIARECLYRKIMEGTTPGQDPRFREWREHFLDAVAAQWRWPRELLDDLRRHQTKNIQQACEQHAVISDQLQRRLNQLMQLVDEPNGSNQSAEHDLRLIGRKLHTFLDPKPDKLEVLTTRGTVQPSPRLTFREQGSSDWSLHVSGDSRSSAQLPIRQADSLLELLGWAVINRVYHRGVAIQLQSERLKLNNSELLSLLETMSTFFAEHLIGDNAELDVYDTDDSLVASLLLINFDQPLMLDNQRQFIMSERSDPLSYGDSRLCFVRSLQRLSVSRWGEISLQTYQGLEGLFDCLLTCFNQTRPMPTAQTLQAICFTPMRGKSIAQRIESIFSRLRQYFASDDQYERQQRYVLAAGSGYCLFRWQNEQLGYYLLETNDVLLQELSKAQPDYSHLRFDDYVLANTYIPFLYGFDQADVIQLFYHSSSKYVAVYVIDEKGAFYARQHTQAEPEHVLRHYAEFLTSLQNTGKLSPMLKCQFYEIQKNSAGVSSCQPLTVKPLNMALRIRIVAERDNDLLMIQCNDRRFSSHEGDFFPRLRQHILSYRKSEEDYPFHITEIDVPDHVLLANDQGLPQTVHYLTYKQKIEEKLNL